MKPYLVYRCYNFIAQTQIRTNNLLYESGKKTP